jgi:mannitol/fructose-specific phosphotransferase system IIA component (Ntr-type)
MVIRNSLQLLEQITDVEEKIQILEARMEALGIIVDREKLIEAILTRNV